MFYPKTIGIYKIKSILGTGGYGNVYLGVHPKTQEKFAIKACNDIEILSKECRILKHLEKIPETLKIFKLGEYPEGSFMVMELLGRSLSYQFQDKILSFECTCAIGFQLLTVLEKIHQKDVIHRDIKPSQFLLTLDKKAVKLIDFGMATFYKVNGAHKEFKTRCKCRGTVSYASINNHLGFKQSRRDDLESLVYSLIYLAKGGLPWKVDTRVEGYKRWQMVLNQKIKISEESLCADLPPEFPALLKYVKKLCYESVPNYAYMRSLLAKFINVQEIFYHFDWYVSDNKPKYVRTSQIVDGATIITKLKREKKIMKKREKKRDSSKKMFKMRIVNSVGSWAISERGLTINSEEEIKHNKRKQSNFNLSGVESIFPEDFEGIDKPKKHSCLLELPTYDHANVFSHKRKKSKKSGKFTKVMSSLDIDMMNNEGHLEDFLNKNRSHEYKKEENDGDVTPRYELPEFKDRKSILQARDAYITETTENTNSKCRVF